MWNSDLTKVKRIIKLIINNVKDSSLDTGAEWEIDVDVVNKIYKIFPVKQINALINSYSPAREKGRKKETVICPHCNKVGAGPIMYRYHFQNCKSIIP